MREVYGPDLLDLLESFPSAPYDGQAWRITFDGQPPERPNIRGARWNPKDVSALYASLSSRCVRAEFEHILDLQPVRPIKPATEYTLRVRLARVLDLTAPERMQQLGLDLDALEDTLAGQEPCQRIGGAVKLLGFEGLLVPSVRFPGGVNLVIYTDNVQTVGVSDVSVVSSQPFRTAGGEAE